MLKTGNTKFGAFGASNQPSYTSSGRPQSSSPTRASSGPANKIDPSDFLPKRFGLKYDPPAIIMEYLVPSSGKLYHHKLKMPQLKANSDTQEIFDALKKKHNQYFAGGKVSDAQIKTLIDKLKTKLENSAPKGGTFLTGTSHSSTSKKNEELKLPGSANSQSKTGGFTGSGYTGSGYTGSGYTGSGYTGSGYTGSGYTNTATSQNNRASSVGKDKNEKNDKKSNFWAFDDVEDEEVDYTTANLNKLSKDELQKHKDKMDVLFNKNQKKPGEAGFIYDKQEEFQPEEENEWDEEF